MFTMLRSIRSSIAILFFLSGLLAGEIVHAQAPPGVYHYHLAVSNDVWESIAPFILPEKHSLKAKLDKIFRKTRAISGMSSLKKAGFKDIVHQKWTRLIVARHPDVKGIIFKLYLDRQRYHKGQPEHYFWIRRCMGARIIREEIVQNHWEHLFKVPKKWIYPLPPTPSPVAGPAKYFILVEEDMNIFSSERNNRLWASKTVTTELLDALFYIIQKHGFYDCAKPDNIPFSKDMKVAFVDTQSFHRWPVAFHKLVWILHPDLANYWMMKMNEIGQ